MPKIKIVKLGSLDVDEIPELGKDYLISFRISRSGTDIKEEDAENPIEFYRMKHLHIEGYQEIGSSRKIGFRKGKSQSQILRFIIEELARAKGKEEEEFYKETMGKIISHYKDKLN